MYENRLRFFFAWRRNLKKPASADKKPVFLHPAPCIRLADRRQKCIFAPGEIIITVKSYRAYEVNHFKKGAPVRIAAPFALCGVLSIMWYLFALCDALALCGILLHCVAPFAMGGAPLPRAACVAMGAAPFRRAFPRIPPCLCSVACRPTAMLSLSTLWAPQPAAMPFLHTSRAIPARRYAIRACVSVPVSQPLHVLSGPPGYRLHRLGPFTVPVLRPRSLGFRPRWLFLSSRGLQSGTPLSGLSFPRLQHPINRRLPGPRFDTPSIEDCRGPRFRRRGPLPLTRPWTAMPPAGPLQKDIWQFVARTFTLDNPPECPWTATDQIRAARRI